MHINRLQVCMLYVNWTGFAEKETIVMYLPLLEADQRAWIYIHSIHAPLSVCMSVCQSNFLTCKNQIRESVVA